VTADGRTVLAGGQDGILHVWSIGDGRSLGAFKK
jgi:hypothetical protein